MYDPDKTPAQTPNAKKSSGQWKLNIQSNLVPCPDLPCTTECPWCYGSGQIAKSTLHFYNMKKLLDGSPRDTDPSPAPDYAENDWALSQESA